jgi:hypothetical protein
VEEKEAYQLLFHRPSYDVHVAKVDAEDTLLHYGKGIQSWSAGWLYKNKIPPRTPIEDFACRGSVGDRRFVYVKGACLGIPPSLCECTLLGVFLGLFECALLTNVVDEQRAVPIGRERKQILT